MSNRLMRPTKRKPSKPGPPTITAAFYDPGDGGTNVQWTAPASNGGAAITGYRVYFNDEYVTPDTIVGSTYYRFESNYAGYTVRVSAVNALGEGPKSTPVVAV